MAKFGIGYSLFMMLMGCMVLFFNACENKPPKYECTDALGCIVLAPDAAIKLGVLQALSGDVSTLGEEQIRGLEMALAERDGHLLNHPVELQVEDTGCTAEGGANAALKIIADFQTVAILGTTCSGAAATASKAVSDAGMCMVSGNNSAPFLTAVGGKRASDWQPGYFRTASNEENAGKAAALYAFEELGVRRAATINDGDLYTRGLSEGFETAFARLGGRIVLSVSINKGDTQMQPVLTAVMNARAQLLFFPLFQPEGNHVLLTARKTAGFENIVLMSDGALIEASFIDAVQHEGRGMYFVGPAHPSGPAIDALARSYQARYNQRPPTSYYLSAYDAANLLFSTIEAVAVKEPGGDLIIGRQALRDALYATRAFTGVTGELNCDEFGDCAYPVFNILRLDDPDGGLAALQANVMLSFSPQKQTNMSTAP